VIRFTREPAYRTFTAPEPVGPAEAEAEAAGDDAAAAADELVAAGADELDELEEELQLAAASPRKARPTTANRARADRYVSIIPTIASATCVSQPAEA
jgi:hypothetical protein